jgi:hypothetical protein
MSTLNKIIVAVFLVVQLISVKSQCDFSGTVAVSTSGYFSGAGYSQEYVLVNDGSDIIMTINTTGTFTPTVSGLYRVYAVNYEGARPAVLAAGQLWNGVVTYAVANCLEYTAPYMNRAISICEQICSGSNLVVSTTGQTAGGGYEQLFVVVNNSGQIVASNSTGAFSGLAVGTHNVYAVNTNDATVKTEINNLGAWSDIPAFSNAFCYQILGPRIFNVVSGPEATFSLVPDCAGANSSFNVQVNVTSLGGASSVNIKDLIPTTYQSGVGAGSYLISGYASGSTQTVIVEDALNSSCFVSQSGLTFTCLNLPTCATVSAGTQAAVALKQDVSSTVAYPQCMFGGWTYYAIDNISPYLFAINWSPDGTISSANENSRDASHVTLTLESAIKAAESASCGTYTSKRYWNVGFSSTIPFNESVKVKYYYDPTENNEVIATKNAFIVANGVGDEGIAWFKTTSNPFVPNQNVTACEVVNTEILNPESTGFENSVNYVIFRDINSFSGGGFTGGASTFVLPIELLDFNCNLNGSIVDIIWKTASETNNDYFTVERSIDGIHFVTILTKAGAGNSTQTISYSDIDRYPFLGLNYYRLKQTDYDGKYTYSDIKTVKTDAESGDFMFELFPNPVQSLLQVKFLSEIDEKYGFEIFDAYGQLIKKGVFESIEKSNHFKIDTQDLSKGIYLIKISSINKSVVKMFVKS